MTKAIEIAAMTLGGLSLFAVCFLGFAVMSGTPLHEVAGIGAFFDAPQVATPGEAGEPGPEEQEKPPKRPVSEVVSAGIGVMGTWTLPAPYTKEELQGLVDELKGKLTTIQQREAHLDERERKLDDQAADLAERFESMERLRVRLEEFQRELDLRELEVQRGEKAVAQEESARWKDVAGILADLDETQAGQRLVEYPPEEAGAILRAMNPEQANAVLNAVDPSRWKEYVDAYTKAR